MKFQPHYVNPIIDIIKINELMEEVILLNFVLRNGKNNLIHDVQYK